MACTSLTEYCLGLAEGNAGRHRKGCAVTSVQRAAGNILPLSRLCTYVKPP
jgi:hypothetical protein